MASKTLRSGCRGRRLRVIVGGRWPCRHSHSASDKSEGYMVLMHQSIRTSMCFITKHALRGRIFMFASSIGPLRWLSRIVLVIVAVFVLLFVLQQGVVRILRRAAPRPMPSRLAPVLTPPWRSRLFGIPEQTLDRSGVMPGMRVLEIGPGPGVSTPYRWPVGLPSSLPYPMSFGIGDQRYRKLQIIFRGSSLYPRRYHRPK
jgi:hypothetical protein